MRKKVIAKNLWKGENYKNNILLFMPDMANELDKGNHYFVGVKVQENLFYGFT